MRKLYLFKIFLLFVAVILCSVTARAQYAIGGEAGTNLVNSVYWLTWDKNATGTTLVSSPAGSDAQHVLAGNYVWQFSPTVQIRATISNLVTTNNQPMQTYTPGSYPSDGLDLIYSSNNQPKPNSRGIAASGLVTPYGGTATFNIDIKVFILINNVWTDVVYPGMIIADAESIDAGGEYISADTPNPIAWQLLNKRTQNNAADNQYKLQLSNGGRSFRLFADLAPGNFGVQAVMFARGARNLTNVGMKGSGLTAMAIGFVLPFDLGDDPLGYGNTGHYMEDFEITNYFAGDGTYAVVNYPTTPLVARSTVYIGENNVDPDGEPEGTLNADGDDTTGNNDENTINPANLPVVKVNQAGNIVFSVPVTNTKSTAATLRVWLDFDGDGRFEADELVSVNVPANTINQTYTITFPNAQFAGKIRVGLLYARMRITTTPLVDDTATAVDERSTSFAADGETEDYRLKDIAGITISGTVFNDGNGGNNGTISGTALQQVSGSPLYAYLVNVATSTVVQKVAVAANGTYALANNNNGNYTVAISTNNVDSGATLAAVTANLPVNWKPSGEAYGTNNTSGTGIETGTPNLQISVSTPGTSLDITGVNFALNQIPVAAADADTTTAGVAVTLNVPANDTDADGTINPAQVFLIDPIDNTKKRTVTVAGQGTYVVNTTTGRVTFTPIASFAGKAIPLSYTIKDNYGSESLPALISVIVKPTGNNDADTTAIGTPVTTVVKANDGTDATATTVTATNGTRGTTTVDAQGRVTYTPQAGYAGVDTYTYVLTTGDGIASDPITVTINITPNGVNDEAITNINTPVTTNVKANDGPAATGATVTSTPGAHGTTTVNTDGNVIYTPVTGYIGKDVYTYTLTRDGIVSPPITVNVTVKPVPVSDTDITPVNTAVTTTVKANDGASGTGTTVTSTPGQHGITSVNAQGQVVYTPVAGYTGIDTYTYTLTTPDGVVSDPVTVTITIYSASVALTKRADNTGSKAGDVINYTLVVTNTGQTPVTNLVVTDVGADAGSISPANIPSLAAGASRTVTARHTLTQADINNRRFSNQASVTGTDQTGRPVSDNQSDDPTTSAANDPTIVIINPVGAISLEKTGVFAANYITYTFTITNTGDAVLNNVTLTDTNLGLTNTAVTIPAGGLIPGGTATLNFRYTLTQADKDAGKVTNNASVNAVDPVGATVTDNATVDVTVDPAPIAVNDNSSTQKNTPVTIDVDRNDLPGNSSFDQQSIEILTQPLHGKVQVGADGTVTYTPDDGYTGTDSFTYRIKDLYGYYTNPATVNLTINANAPFKIPTLFTPNGDGINDVFEIRGIEQYGQTKLSIINRWGNEVYKATNYQNNWTGEGLNEGTYYYLLQVRDAQGNWNVYKGYITLMRSLKK
ncbi:CshA/CshB family fibrillar adhesin-related protein [Mucilaginibacter sp. UR6-1]|uniref:CshA/CshB family fibrillar adhesin-related protein n=1 Tax=Mucilaginibacter sp. UR6-1 TaxID=1435643 RepID=UPI001E2C2387|nr:CshA/CshB family fibrillar adhesin-related protein [Mucilaginibacter sp. UR6-1]MCC8407961.1 CshA/CshB family fibrillar adhesin-related protein [Mucilaginibacter sp. UR6-1]